MTGIKCRCGTHMAIMRAIKRAAGRCRPRENAMDTDLPAAIS